MRIIAILRRRLSEKRGFTLSETLITILILLMVSAIVAGGVPAAANAYYKIIDAANAQILLTDTVTSLRSELATATNVKTNASNELQEYTSGNSGWTKTLSNPSDGIKISESSTLTGIVTGAERLLVQSKMSGAVKTGKLVNSYSKIEFDKTTGIFTITELKVQKDGNTLAEIGELKIQNIVYK